MKFEKLCGFIFGIFLTVVSLSTVASADPFVVSTVNDSGVGSLRQAVIDAGNHIGADTIVFAIGTGVQRIELLSQIEIDSVVDIDGTTQPGTGSSPRIEIRKSFPSVSADSGLRLLAGNSKIHGLRFLNFIQPSAALRVMAVEVLGENNSIYGNVFGAETGIGEPNHTALRIAANNNRVGFYLDGNNNEIISPNLFRKNDIGIALEAEGRNVIKGNLIVENDVGNNFPGGFSSKGINADGRNEGVEIIDNTIFGAGDEGYGIFLNATVNALIQFNRIGVDADGHLPMFSQFDGIDITSGANNRIFDNIVSGNSAYGINSDSVGTRIERNTIGLGGDGETIIPNSVGILLQNQGGIIGGDNSTGLVRNYITGNTFEQIKISISNGGLGVIQGNVIGLTRKEGNSAPGTGTGVGGTTSSGTVKVGGSTPGVRNIISGNFGDGIRLGVDDSGTGVTNIEIANNCIGTNLSCSVTANGFGNHFNGIRIDSFASIIQIIGNTIAFNGERGILIPTQNQQNTSGNNVEISRNSIFGNFLENIFLGRNGNQPINDQFDIDQGGNNLQNGTNVLNAAVSGNMIISSGTFFGKILTSFEVQFFYSESVCANSPATESRYIGSTMIATNANGDASFNNIQLPFPSGMQSNGSVQAVVINRQPISLADKDYSSFPILQQQMKKRRTDRNNSSEYSPCVAVNAIRKK